MSSECCSFLFHPAVNVATDCRLTDCKSCIIFAYMSTTELSCKFTDQLTQNCMFFDKSDLVLACSSKSYVHRNERSESEIVSDAEGSGNTCSHHFNAPDMPSKMLQCSYFSNTDNMICRVNHLQNSDNSSHCCALQPRAVFRRIQLLQMDSHLAGIVTEEMIRSPVFVNHFLKYVAKMGICCRKLECSACGFSLKVKSMSHPVCCTVVQMSIPSRLFINYSWCHKILDLVTKRMMLEDAMNWLSTLGGAYSALGDYFEHHAVSARVISLRQLRIALEMGSPPVVIRCCLYLSLSLMQSGRLHEARILIRQKYAEAKRLPVTEKQLLSICRGLWSRLRYLRSIKRQGRS